MRLSVSRTDALICLIALSPTVIAASSGNKTAVKNKDIVEKKLTIARIEDAQKLAREYIHKKYKGH